MRQAAGPLFPFVRFPVSYLHFSLPHSVICRVQIHLPYRRASLRFRLSLSLSPAARPASRDDCTSFPVKFFSQDTRGDPIETNRFARCRWHGEQQSKRRIVNIGRPFSIYPSSLRALSYFDKKRAVASSDRTEIAGHSYNFPRGKEKSKGEFQISRHSSEHR